MSDYTIDDTSKKTSSMATSLEVEQIPRGDEDPLLGIKGYETWRYAWPRAIAFAWESPTHEGLLLSDPHAVFEALGFDIPKGLRIEVVKYSGNKEYSRDSNDISANGWNGMETELAGKVVMTLPPKPSDSKLQGMAIVDYEATGKTFPFTSC